MFLERILREKEREVEELKRVLKVRSDGKTGRERKTVDLKKGKVRNIIAEIKRHSPSRGVLGSFTDPKRLAAQYIRGGAKAISVLTDGKFFHGSGEDLRGVASVSKGVPVLRKDFLIHEIQIFESLDLGADMVLLIARILSKNQLKHLIRLCGEIGITPLVEVHDRGELDTAMECGADLVGINNRDLESFRVDLSISEELLPLIPGSVTKIVESGMSKRADMERLERLGADAFLIGEALVSAEDPAGKLKEYIEQ